MHPALQFQPSGRAGEGGKRAKLDSPGQQGKQVKNAVATLNEIKPGLAYELVETKGWTFVESKKDYYVSLRDGPCSLLCVPSDGQQ